MQDHNDRPTCRPRIRPTFLMSRAPSTREFLLGNEARTNNQACQTAARCWRSDAHILPAIVGLATRPAPSPQCRCFRAFAESALRVLAHCLLFCSLLQHTPVGLRRIRKAPPRHTSQKIFARAAVLRANPRVPIPCASPISPDPALDCRIRLTLPAIGSFPNPSGRK